MCVLFSGKDFKCMSFVIILLEEMPMVLSIMPLLIFQKRRLIVAILNVVFFLSIKVFTTLSITKRSGENTLQSGC